MAIFCLFACALLAADGEAPLTKTALGTDEAGDRWPKAYQWESARYVLRTDVPEREGEELIRSLDRLQSAFFEEFAEIIPEERLEEKLVVYFYGDHKRFESSIKKVHPGMELSDGFVNTGDNIAHLFRIETKLKGAVVPDRESMFHECTHQLMNTLLGGERDSAGRPHFWAVEGIACLFESLDIDNDTHTIGKRLPGRFRVVEQAAARLKKIRLADFLQMTQKEMLSASGDPKAPETNYIYASLLSYYLCAVGDGKYKRSFLTYVREIYRGKAKSSTFDETIGLEVEGLETDLRQFIDRIGKEIDRNERQRE
ncbi:MAG: hypothetical protein A2Z34_11205 [Planctomycetes bacterium RBG_16_59_8]|nr:MAG: hypothetical protein A2Z34_11205 [Planctomycetes bacterium RBG_16_59_8]